MRVDRLTLGSVYHPIKDRMDMVTPINLPNTPHRDNAPKNNYRNSTIDRRLITMPVYSSVLFYSLPPSTPPTLKHSPPKNQKSRRKKASRSSAGAKPVCALHSCPAVTMAADTMDIDSNPIPAGQAEAEKERKRKHKHKDEPSSSSPSKKKRKHEKGDKESKKKDKSSKSSSKDKSKDKDKDKSETKSKTRASKPATTPTTAIPDSPYSVTTATLYLPLSPISISPTHALASLLAEHLSPLLLTYYPPLQGIILAYSNASISSEPPRSPTQSTSQSQPQPLTLANSAGEYGVLYVYLTATFLVFRPQRGQTLEGWVNVQSEGFLGAVVLNLFSVGIERKRLPSSWKWIPPGEEVEGENGPTASTTKDVDEDNKNEHDSSPFDPAKELFTPVPLSTATATATDKDKEANPSPLDPSEAQQDQTYDPTTEQAEDHDSYEGHFQSISGHRVRGTVQFRVVDIDVIPGTERDRGFLSIEGTMLSEAEEEKVLEDERGGVVAGTTPTPGMRKFNVPMASGAVGEPEVQDVELDAEESPSKAKGKEKGKGKKSKK